LSLHLIVGNLIAVTISNEMISLYKETLLDQESLQINLGSELVSLKTALSNPRTVLENTTFGENREKIFKVSQELSIQEKDLKLFLEQNPSTELIGEFTSVQKSPRTILFALIGFIAGLLLSITLVFIRGSIKGINVKKEITL
jgi:hypothetical protein